MQSDIRRYFVSSLNTRCTKTAQSGTNIQKRPGHFGTKQSSANNDDEQRSKKWEKSCLVELFDLPPVASFELPPFLFHKQQQQQQQQQETDDILEEIFSEHSSCDSAVTSQIESSREDCKKRTPTCGNLAVSFKSKDHKPATLEDSNSGNVSLWTKKRKRDANDALLNQINHINTLKKHATTYAFFKPKDNMQEMGVKLEQEKKKLFSLWEESTACLARASSVYTAAATNNLVEANVKRHLPFVPKTLNNNNNKDVDSQNTHHHHHHHRRHADDHDDGIDMGLSTKSKPINQQHPARRAKLNSFSFTFTLPVATEDVATKEAPRKTTTTTSNSSSGRRRRRQKEKEEI